MYVIEFYLQQAIAGQAFETLCNTFYTIPSPFKRRVDGQISGAVFAVSRNLNTRWVQLLIDEDTLSGVLTAIRTKAIGLSDNGLISEYHNNEGTVTGVGVNAPMERKREVIGI